MSRLGSIFAPKVLHPEGLSAKVSPPSGGFALPSSRAEIRNLIEPEAQPELLKSRLFVTIPLAKCGQCCSCREKKS
jgi:hypothetical protein